MSAMPECQNQVFQCRGDTALGVHKISRCSRCPPNLRYAPPPPFAEAMHSSEQQQVLFPLILDEAWVRLGGRHGCSATSCFCADPCTHSVRDLNRLTSVSANFGTVEFGGSRL